MASSKPKAADQQTQKQPMQDSKKRKEPPAHAHSAERSDKRARFDNRKKSFHQARTLAAQTSSKAFKNGEIDVDKFVKSREYEVRALEKGLRDGKKVLTQRAFQQVPKDLRRRTASHNVKKVPRKLQARAKREIIEDNTPTGKSRRRTISTHQRLRFETAKRLRHLGTKPKGSSKKGKDNAVTVRAVEDALANSTNAVSKPLKLAIKPRRLKVKTASLAQPPTPKAKFRKRQRLKSWLPTHMFHTKRAHMSLPSDPMWRFSVPMTPTTKSYRPTHRAANERGCLCWDMSYISTISLEGSESSLVNLLRQLNVPASILSGTAGMKWRGGRRFWSGLAFERERQKAIAPVTVIWQVLDMTQPTTPTAAGNRARRLLIRVHPSAFTQLWEEITRLAKIVKPGVKVEDLRFEVGSIALLGPGSCEALVGALRPSPPAQSAAHADDSVESTFGAMCGVQNAALLPRSCLLAFEVQDPRLQYPPQTVNMSRVSGGSEMLYTMLAAWPPDITQGPASIFQRRARSLASTRLPSQKAINRRRALADPGSYPPSAPNDPHIPLLLYPAPHSSDRNAQPTWIMLLPWKCVTPVWYSLMYYPLSTGGQPKFGGLKEQQQLAFERGEAWFPGDMPGTESGWEWEVRERARRFDEWRARPKAKRTAFDKVHLGGGSAGEVGEGWACDWERLLHGGPKVIVPDTDVINKGSAANALTNGSANKAEKGSKRLASPPPAQKPANLYQIPPPFARLLTDPCSSPSSSNPPTNGLATVRLHSISRGIPQTCARIYRLPSSTTPAGTALREQWLALHPGYHPGKVGAKNSLPKIDYNEPAYIVQRKLAQSLLQPPASGETGYPACPGEGDLIGFVTSGNFNLAEGRGTGIGNILLERVLADVANARELRAVDKSKIDESKLCVVRNAGHSVGRLARWEIIEYN